MTTYTVQARIVLTSDHLTKAPGWTYGVDVPTFALSGNVNGITAPSGAGPVALRTVDPTGILRDRGCHIYVSVMCTETGDYWSGLYKPGNYSDPITVLNLAGTGQNTNTENGSY